jgi:hypothetical protein
MKFSIKSIAFVSIFAASIAANAAGWAGPAKVSAIYPSPGSGGAFIQTTSSSSNVNPDNCSSPGYPLLEKSNPMFNQIFALAMAAQARGSLINFQYNGCGGPAGSSYPLIGQVIAN